jgi:4-amino-4-deoxy-L-arabinose transferase-like glycosyltransferase
VTRGTGAGRPAAPSGRERGAGRSPGPASRAAPDPRAAALTLLAITLVAAFLRIFRLDQVPPGLNQDEALSSWISWCLLKTGHDMTGQAWPIFVSHGIGDFPSTLFFYTLMPFQALGGLNLWTARLPAALSGVLAIPLAAYVGTKLFGSRSGLVAAAMLAFNPWHLFLSRFGVGACQCPLFALIVIALMIKAGMPLVEPSGAEPRPLWAGLAGLAAGVSCYGFPALRLYWPALFVLLVAVDPTGWWNLNRSRAGFLAVLLFAIGFAIPGGPLAWEQFTDPHIGHRWEMTRLWPTGTSLPRIVALVAERYAAHFHPDFLFVRGGHDRAVNPLGRGAFEWYALPCMLAGLVFAAIAARRQRAARLLLALVLAYPAGDLISQYDGIHPLRSAPGLPALVLLAGFGAFALWRWLRERARVPAALWALALAGSAVACEASNLPAFFGPMDQDPYTYHFYAVDLVRGAEWVRPRLGNYDAVFCTTIGTLAPFSIFMVELGWDPHRWFTEPRDVRLREGWEVYLRVGKLRFMYDKLWVPDYQRLVVDGKTEHALFMVRPGELGLKSPVYTIRRPDGREVLWLCEVDI